jgi:hypothetical protein
MTKELEKKINDLSTRLEKIERFVGIKNDNFHAEIDPPQEQQIHSTIIHSPENDAALQIHPEFQKKTNSLSGVMGFLGMICILFALILLIKLSIDSGWLTPLRQIIIATMLGVIFTITPQIVRSQDSSYLSLLPALGIIVLHLCVYGGVFYHHIFDATTGLFSTSIISIFSLYLLQIYQEDYYAVFSIIGTYIGAMILNTAFDNLYYFSAYLILWNIIFSIFSIKMNNRFFLTLAAYLSLFFVTIISLYKQEINYIELSALQFIQITIYSYFIAKHSIIHKTKMSEQESLFLFPLFVFFYATEFYFLDKVNPYYATSFAVIFSLIILSLTFNAKKRLKEQKLESLNAIYSFVAIMFYHSIFIMLLGPYYQPSFGLVLLILMGWVLIKGDTTPNEFRGVSIISSLVIFYLILSTTFNIYQLNEVFIFNIIYGLIFLGFALIRLNAKSFINKETILLVAHSQIILAIYRLHNIVHFNNSALLIVTYAFIILGIAVKRNDRILAKSSFPVILIGFLIGISANIAYLNTLKSIIGLAIMGLLIYISGYLYRKIPT